MTETQVLVAAGGLILLCIGALGFALFGSSEPNRARKFRREQKAPVERKGGSAGFKALFAAEQQSAADRLREMAEEQQRAEKANLRLRLVQAGVETSPARFLAGFYIAALAVGAVAYVATGNPFVAGAVAVIIGFLGPRSVLSSRTKRRLKQFSEHFPGALDIIIRGVRSGLPVSESLKIVSKESPAPVGPEIERLVVGSSLGQSLHDGLDQMAMRVPSKDVNFFRTVLAIQQKTGGNLAETLENLSNVLRERKKMKLKVHALSSEARMSAIIIGSLPFVVGLLVYILRPDYIALLFEDPRGHWMIGGGLVWMSFGVMAMRSMVRFEV